MKKFTSLCVATLLLSGIAFGQKVNSNLKFKKGQKIEVVSTIKSTASQEAMGQTIDFNIDGTITDSYNVLETSDKTSKLSHKVDRVMINMEGMGQSHSFDSDKKEDLDGEQGAPVKKILNSGYEMSIDGSGKVLDVKATGDTSKVEGGMDLDDAILPGIGSSTGLPKVGGASFFSVLPAKPVGKGDSWNDSTAVDGGMQYSKYTITDITATEILIDEVSNSKTSVANEMMGMETVTNLTNKTNAKITLDKVTGLLKKKETTIDSNGTVEVMGQSVPITNKITSTVNVKF